MSDQIKFTATIMNGALTVGPIDDPDDFERVKSTLMPMMSNIGSTVVETECLTPDEREALAQRLVEHLLARDAR